jgi:hypothetical protein
MLGSVNDGFETLVGVNWPACAMKGCNLAICTESGRTKRKPLTIPRGHIEHVESKMTVG